MTRIARIGAFLRTLWRNSWEATNDTNCTNWCVPENAVAQFENDTRGLGVRCKLLAVHFQ
jgi:hypothetical protein